MTLIVCGVATGGTGVAAASFGANPGIIPGKNLTTITTATKSRITTNASKKNIPPLRFVPGAMVPSYIKMIFV
jgi:hypothetical protein